jgi:polyisoprenoid-binding protein YceI
VTRTVTGSVATGDGWPLSSATVTLIGADGRQAGRAGVDGTGRFTLPVEESLARATVVVAAPGHDPYARTAHIGAHGVDVGLVTLRRPGEQDVPRPGRWEIDPAHTTVSATAQHLGLSRVHGRFTRFAGEILIAEDPAQSRVEARIEAASIDTGNAQRDAHLRSPDFLDVERFSELTYRSTALEPVGPRHWTVCGELTIIGIPREVPLDLRYGGSGPDPWGGTRVAFTATTRLDRSDYRMNWNQAVGVGIALVGTHLQVELDVQAVLVP